MAKNVFLHQNFRHRCKKFICLSIKAVRFKQRPSKKDYTVMVPLDALLWFIVCHLSGVVCVRRYLHVLSNEIIIISEMNWFLEVILLRPMWLSQQYNSKSPFNFPRNEIRCKYRPRLVKSSFYFLSLLNKGKQKQKQKQKNNFHVFIW